MTDFSRSSTPVSGSPTPARSSSVPASAFARLGQVQSIAKQIDDASKAELPDRPTVKDLPKILFRSRRFVLESQLYKKTRRGRKSWIGAHGVFLTEIGRGDESLGPVWCCHICDRRGRPEFFACTATTSSADHLRT